MLAFPKMVTIENTLPKVLNQQLPFPSLSGKRLAEYPPGCCLDPRESWAASSNISLVTTLAERAGALRNNGGSRGFGHLSTSGRRL